MKKEIKYYWDVVQGGNAWFEARLGIVTASNINKLVTPTGKPAAGAKVLDFAYKIAGERLTWRMDHEFQGFEMERGQIEEGLARQYYNDAYDEVKLCGFIKNSEHGFTIGCSPDGLVGEDGGIEIKSRIVKFQIETVANDTIEPDYINQIQTCLLVSGRKWWDFVQYSNGMPLYVKRVLPDEVRQIFILDAVRAFEDQVKEIVKRYEANVKNFVNTTFVENVMGDEISESEED